MTCCNECEKYKVRCEMLDRVLTHWIEASPIDKDGKLINPFAAKAKEILLNRICLICNEPGTECQFCDDGICTAVFCTEHRYFHEKSTF
jgi:hypothetical protein